jgi:hypothetical protein
MTPRGPKAGLCAFVTLSVGVAVNVTFLQRSSAAGRAVRGALEPVAPDANAQARRAIAANPSDGILPSRQPNPAPGVGGHDGQPAISIAGPIPTFSGSGGTVGDSGRVGKGTSTLNASSGAHVIRAVQRELGRRGYNPGVPNGVINGGDTGGHQGLSANPWTPANGRTIRGNS